MKIKLSKMVKDHKIFQFRKKFIKKLWVNINYMMKRSQISFIILFQKYLLIEPLIFNFKIFRIYTKYIILIYIFFYF